MIIIETRPAGPDGCSFAGETPRYAEKEVKNTDMIGYVKNAFVPRLPRRFFIVQRQIYVFLLVFVYDSNGCLPENYGT